MNRRIFLVTGASTAAGFFLPGCASAMGQSHRDAPIAILRPDSVPQAVDVANGLADMLAAASQSANCQQFDIDGADTRATTRVLTAPTCSKWLAILPPADAVIVTELARGLGLGLRWSGRHVLDEAGIRHHGLVAGVDESLNWQADSRNWEKQLAALYFDILTGIAPTIETGSPRKATGKAFVELACLLLTK